MVDKAQRKGWYGGYSKTTKPGDLFIIDGKHVGFINQVRNDGTFATIEGNVSDGCRSLIRSWRDGWNHQHPRALALPALRQSLTATDSTTPA
jgi:hypothetical protein